MVHAFVVKNLLDLLFRTGGQYFRSWLEVKALKIQLQFVWKDGKRIYFCLSFLFPREELILPLRLVESSGEIAQSLLDISKLLVNFTVVDDDGWLREFLGGLEALAGRHVEDVRGLDVSGLKAFQVGMDVGAEDVGNLRLLHLLVHPRDHHAL